MKGFVTIFELILVILILIGTFTLFFPRFAYEARWDEALLLLKGRDVILTIDRIGKLYEYSFNFSALRNFLDQKAFPGEFLIYLPVVEGTIKSRIHVACNCTDEEKKIITDWLRGPKGKAPLRINDRDIDFYVCITHLEELNPCLSKDADLLIIWGNKSLGPHRDLLKGHLERGNGIIEVRDFGAGDIDVVQREIFGIAGVASSLSPEYINFSRKPTSTADILYGPWKYFYHIPINLEYDTLKNKGYLTFRQIPYTFWINSSTVICIDLNRNDVCNSPDELVSVKSNFQIAGYNFYLSYIRENVAIGISFKPEYNFSDFLGGVNVRPYDETKALLYGRGAGQLLLPAVILNSTPISRVAWMANFTEDGIGDDERLLFISLLLWVSNQREMLLRDIPAIAEYLKVAYSTSYVNTVNIDMFEVYKFKLGIGYPYK